MSSRCLMKYQSLRAYKYRLAENYEHRTALKCKEALVVGDGWIVLHPDGLLQIRAGYCWDGPSGPTIDTPNWMRASLVHDAIYQLIREALIAREEKFYADDLMYRILREDGMSRFRARYSYLGVRFFGWTALGKIKAPPIRCAPTGDPYRTEA